jgi:large subunit ribosomal protein L10
MSKYVKNLIAEHLRDRLQGVNDALLVNMIGLNADATSRLRKELREKNIQVVVVKNSMAARAADGTPLAAMFEGVSGTSAICWGGEDIISLAKEIVRLADDEKLAPFAARGGVMDGERLTAEQVKEVSKWPSRQEQLSLLVGQILGPGAKLASQLLGPGGALASQIGQLGEAEEGAEAGAGAEDAPAAETT